MLLEGLTATVLALLLDLARSRSTGLIPTGSGSRPGVWGAISLLGNDASSWTSIVGPGSAMARLTAWLMRASSCARLGSVGAAHVVPNSISGAFSYFFLP